MVGEIEAILLEPHALLSEETEQIQIPYDPKCVCSLAEENICESCLAPVLPAGKVVGRGKPPNVGS